MIYETKIVHQPVQEKNPTFLAIKSLTEEGVFAGYASVFNILDSQNDIMLPGAFKQSLEESARVVKLLWQHDMSEPIGIIEELREDELGLYVKGRLMLNLARGREAFSLLKEGIISGLSIGYTPKRYATNPETGIRYLQEIDLWEVSLVTFPANNAAQVTVLKQKRIEIPVNIKQEIRSGNMMRLAAALERATQNLVE